MKNKASSLLLTILLAMLMVSPVLAGPGIELSNVRFSLGSLIAEGTLARISSTDLKVILAASGEPEIICTNQGSNPAPGQNPPDVNAAGAQNLQDRTKNGKTEFDVRAIPPDMLPGTQGGCPNDNWTAHIVFVYWENARITVTNLAGDILLVQEYTCQTQRNPDAVTCTPR